jgi:hypothetical protein
MPKNYVAEAANCSETEMLPNEQKGQSKLDSRKRSVAHFACLEIEGSSFVATTGLPKASQMGANQSVRLLRLCCPFVAALLRVRPRFRFVFTEMLRMLRLGRGSGGGNRH